MTELQDMVRRWKADADQYQKQVAEARAKKLPHDQMLSMMVCLRACAKEVEVEWIKLAVAYNKPIVMAKGKDTIGPLDQDALECGSMMPEGWQTETELTTDRDERESANSKSSASGDENQKPK